MEGLIAKIKANSDDGDVNMDKMEAHIQEYKKSIEKINELTEFTAKDGIYWKEGSAYCVKEKHLMSKHYQNVCMKNSYYCVACKQLYELPNNENNTDVDIVKPVSTGIYF